MLQINNLSATVGGKPILKGLSLSVNAGEIHAIMGPNGAGKSTLSYVLGGRPGYEVTGGRVNFTPHSARPEPVEGLPFSARLAPSPEEKKQCFDKLSTSGVGWGWGCGSA